MRFFNLDFHIGVIGDIKQIFQSLGHEVTDWTLSGHSWVLGRDNDKVDVISSKSFMSFNKAMCNAFYERYKHELNAYDGFIVTHTPCLSMLYEQFDKPIICVTSTRYEHPFSANREAWESFNSFLRAKIDDGLLIPIANNRYDADYSRLFTDREWRVIPSICDYTSAPYTGTRDDALLSSKFDGLPPIRGMVRKDREFKESFISRAARKLGFAGGKRGYSWQEIAAFKSIVWIPYNASIMSIFEMYTNSIPMFFPSRSFLAKLVERFGMQEILSELSYNQVRGMPPESVIPCGMQDPNNYKDVATMMYWAGKADYYDAENMAALVYFNSFEELEHLIHAADMAGIHNAMSEHNVLRKQRAHSAWKQVLATVEQRL